MGRKDYQFFPITCVGGIDQQEGLGDPQKTCTDARDVWAPDGKLMRRPGYTGVVGDQYQVNFASWEVPSQTTMVGQVGVTYYNPVGPSGTVTLPANSVNPIYYAGRASKFTSVSIQILSAIENDYSFDPFGAYHFNCHTEYWNGTTWVELGYEAKDIGIYVNTDHPKPYIWGIPHPFYFTRDSYGYTMVDVIPPSNWATTTVNGNGPFYYLRFRLVGTAGPIVPVYAPWNTYSLPSYGGKIKGMIKGNLSSGTNIVYIENANDPGYSKGVMILVAKTSIKNGKQSIYAGLNAQAKSASFAVIADFNEVYAATSEGTFLVTSAYDMEQLINNPNVIFAKVEDNPFLVGPTSAVPVGTIIPYNKDPSATGYIDQLTEWPRSKLLTYFRGEMWAAGFDGSPSQVRWSAPQPYYKVWPTLNTEFLIQNDSTPITALYGFQQNMLVFKQNSIWRMVDTGISANKLQTYVPECVVNGIGTISANSIASVVHAGNYGVATDMLAFLAEDGVYLYNSGNVVTKISQRIYRTIAAINPSLRSEAVGVNWKEKNLYLLSVAVDGADHNNLTIVWDYKNDSWWLWTIGAQSWLYDYDGISVGKLYFGDNHGQIFQLNIGDTDYGAQITPYVTSQRVAFDGTTRRLRQIEIHGNSRDRTMNLAVIRNDEPLDAGVTLSMKDGLEKDWSNLTYNVDHWVNERHRVRRAMYSKSGEWFQVKVTGSSTEPADFEIHDIIFGFETLGRRR